MRLQVVFHWFLSTGEPICFAPSLVNSIVNMNSIVNFIQVLLTTFRYALLLLEEFECL